MPLIPVESRKSADGAKWAAEIERALGAARKRIARRRTLSFAASTLAVPVAAAAVWAALVRFTLLDIQAWPALLFMPAWLVALFVASRRHSSRHSISSGQSARYLDRALHLDERLSTCVEFIRATPVKSLGLGQQSAYKLPIGLLEDTAFQLKTRRGLLPNAWSFRLQRWQGVAVGCALLILAGAILLPTPLDAVRAERAELRRAVSDELAKIQALKAELVARPGLTDDSKAAIGSELGSLERALQAPSIDRSAMLAALSDAQQRIQQLSPQSSADFDNIIAAARTVQDTAVYASRNASTLKEAGWDPSDFPQLSELAKAADAAGVLASKVIYLTNVQIRSATPSLERASTQAAPDDAELAQHLLDASRAIGMKDAEKGSDALKAAAQRFLDADHRWQLAQAVERAMADLDQGRQTLAQAGAQQLKKGQVGFRRPGAQPPGAIQPAQGGAPGNGTPTGGDQSNGDTHGVSRNDPSALGPNMGSNSPDFEAAPKSGTNGGAPGSQSSSSGKSNSQTANGPGGSAQTGSTGASSGGQPGSSAGGGNDGSTGTFSGQVTGPVGGTGGAISQVPNPQGRGIVANGGQQDQQNQTDNGQPDSVYVPPTTENAPPDAGGGVPGQAAPPQQNDGIQGRSADGGDGTKTQGEKGGGARTTIRTPYKEIIGQYAEQATQALAQVYVPADAKEYVKEYFTELGK